MTRPSDITRERIMKAAERLFAERGYDSTSIRAIVAKARVNQAAINSGKEGLYREVLRAAFRALTEHQLAHAEEAKAASREQALRAFIRRQLRPLTARDELSRHLRIFNWETVRPTPAFRKLMSEEAAPFMGVAVDLGRRFLPKADQRTLSTAAIWLIGQCGVSCAIASSWPLRRSILPSTKPQSSAWRSFSAAGRSAAWRSRLERLYP